jgi:competence protein ComEA
MQTKSLPTRFISIVAPVLLMIALAFSTATVQGASKSKAKVDVNSASVETLETLPGIGPTLADRIVAGRPYKNADELANVKGLSKSKVDAFQDQITFGKAKKSTTKSTKTTTESSSAETSSSSKSTTYSKPTTTHDSYSSKTVTTTTSSSGKLAPGQTVNINTASAEQLDALPGIGPTKAQAIIDYRSEHGRFSSIEDIQNVKGIKEGEFSKIKDYIRVR